MSKLGFEKFSVAGHDRGGRIAHKLCVDYPDKVNKAMFLDIAPTLAMFEATDQEFATAYWHWFWLIQVCSMLLFILHILRAAAVLTMEREILSTTPSL
jgi:pimeloyl-ACP methyl ester carboxylesterase